MPFVGLPFSHKQEISKSIDFDISTFEVDNIAPHEVLKRFRQGGCSRDFNWGGGE